MDFEAGLLILDWDKIEDVVSEKDNKNKSNPKSISKARSNQNYFNKGSESIIFERWGAVIHPLFKENEIVRNNIENKDALKLGRKRRMKLYLEYIKHCRQVGI